MSRWVVRRVKLEPNRIRLYNPLSGLFFISAIIVNLHKKYCMVFATLCADALLLIIVSSFRESESHFLYQNKAQVAVFNPHHTGLSEAGIV